MKFLKSVVLWLIISRCLFASEVELAEQLLHSYRNHQLIPLVSSINPDLSVKQAYIVQNFYVKKRFASDKLVGFKAGLTSPTGQKKFNVNQALAGVLFASGDLSAVELIKLSQFKHLMLETEIGFEIGKTITGSIGNQTELKQYIKAVFPVIELPDLGFAGKPTGVDIIAANAGAAAFIKGKPFTDFADLDLNRLTAKLSKDGKIINIGLGNDALGDQWEAALWLVNTVVVLGWVLEPGQFFITGAMGQMIKAEAGDYQADFGELGNISFLIISD